jgi:hypothetical protein
MLPLVDGKGQRGRYMRGNFYDIPRPWEGREFKKEGRSDLICSSWIDKHRKMVIKVYG